MCIKITTSFSLSAYFNAFVCNDCMFCYDLCLVIIYTMPFLSMVSL